MVLVEVQYEKGDPETYFLPLGRTFGKDAEQLRENFANAIICPAISEGGSGFLHDATCDENACAALLSFIEHGKEAPARNGSIRGVPGTQFQAMRGPEDVTLTARRGSAEQSNTSVIYGDRLILKFFRRQQPGPNPDCEIGRYLTEKAISTAFRRLPVQSSTLPTDGEPYTLAMLQGLVANQGDGWTLALEELARYYENCATVEFPEGGSAAAANLMDLAEHAPSQFARDHVGIAIDAAARLGKRTAELHLMLASPTADPAFAPTPLTASDVQGLLTGLRLEAALVFDLLKDSVAGLPDELIDLAGLVLGRRKQNSGQLSACRRETTCSANGSGFTATIISARYCRSRQTLSSSISKASRRVPSPSGGKSGRP